MEMMTKGPNIADEWRKLLQQVPAVVFFSRKQETQGALRFKYCFSAGGEKTGERGRGREKVT